MAAIVTVPRKNRATREPSRDKNDQASKAVSILSYTVFASLAGVSWLALLAMPVCAQAGCATLPVILYQRTFREESSRRRRLNPTCRIPVAQEELVDLL